MGKGTPEKNSDGVSWKPKQLPLKCIRYFPEVFFYLSARAKNKKMTIFRRCLEISGKAE